MNPWQPLLTDAQVDALLAEEKAAIALIKQQYAAEVLSGAWIVTCHHEHCSACSDEIDNAIAHAKVTGSIGATYNTVKDGITHGAKVERETYEQRREALGAA